MKNIHTVTDKLPVIILHGWATTMSGQRYAQLAKILEKNSMVFVPDLPGFGSEPLIKDVMDLDDYVDYVVAFMKKKNIKKADFIGHSFGGRIAVKLAYVHPELVGKLVLSGAPLVRTQLSLKKTVAFFVAKSGKIGLQFFPGKAQRVLRKVLYRSIGEWDYYKAGNLQETFKRIINEDLAPILPEIKTKTLLVWGQDDTFVPLVIARKIKTLLPDSDLKIVAHATHKLPYENPETFADIVSKFLWT
ncbi:MAG TPA: alpha/beta hydrolase [Candidatus Saccharimonadales bacterium]|nr:alpha/beta hydrolase [Candidatus Saccharimonadales bacterium]